MGSTVIANWPGVKWNIRPELFTYGSKNDRTVKLDQIDLNGAWRVTIYISSGDARDTLQGIQLGNLTCYNSTINLDFPTTYTVLQMGGAVANGLPVLLKGYWNLNLTNVLTNPIIILYEYAEPC
jgi:hypothetical protein